MFDVLAVVQVIAALLLLAPLLIIAVCALRGAGRKIDRIVREECSREVFVPETRPPEPGHVSRLTTRATHSGDSPTSQ